MAANTIELRFFASLREAVGEQATFEAPAATTVGAVRDALIARGAPWADVLARQRAVRCAVNKTMCVDEATPVQAGDELAFFPPVTGG